jgi:hypothetical protein
MNTNEFWDLIESARRLADDPADSDQIASEASTLLATRPREEIIAAEHALYELLGDSYLLRLWAAAYLINGGCSDDGFTMRHPELDKAWDFDFDDQEEMARRLPKLTALYSD